MNGQLNKYVVNPWLVSATSSALITFFFVAASQNSHPDRRNHGPEESA
jgi:hypothetical protein